MRILFLSDIFPFPPYHGSAVISYHWARLLATRHEVVLQSVFPPNSEDCVARLEKLGIRVEVSERRLVRRLSVLHSVFLAPRAMRAVRTKELGAAYRRLVSSFCPDVTVMIGPALGSILSVRLQQPPIVFVPYDSESLSIRSRLPYVRNPLRRVHGWLELRKWEFVEASLYCLADACVAVTEDDASVISRRWKDDSRNRLYVVPNGVDVRYFFPMGVREVDGRVVITGNMWSVESRLSVQWFLECVIPLVRARLRHVTVDIVGRDPAPSLLSAAKSVGGVFVHGYVPDIRPYLARGSVYVAPLRFGSGIKNRVIEALAMGKAVVATPEGVRGIKIRAGRDALVASTAEEFAEAVTTLLQDAELRRSMGDAGRVAVDTHHSWDVLASKIETLIAAVVAGSPVARTDCVTPLPF